MQTYITYIYASYFIAFIAIGGLCVQTWWRQRRIEKMLKDEMSDNDTA